MKHLSLGNLLSFFLLIAIGVVLFLNNRTAVVKNQFKDEIKALKDSITHTNHLLDSLSNENQGFKDTINLYQDSVDILSKYKPKVRIKYDTQKKNITNSSISNLDSIIRSNSGLDSVLHN